MTAAWSAIRTTATVIAHANIVFIVIACAVDTLSLVLMSVRWRLLLRPVGSQASLWDALLAYSAGVFVCNVTPARTVGGDTCRATLIPRPGGQPPLKAVAASVVYDRLTDVPRFLLLGVLALPTLGPRTPHWLLLVLGGIVLAALLRLLLARFIRWIGRRYPAMMAPELRRGLAAAAAWSIVIWLLDITRIMLVGAAFAVRFTPSQAAAVSLLRLGSGLIPVPGGIGVVDGALIAGFLWLGLPASTAAALAVVERAIVLGWATALGAAALLLLGGRRAFTRARTGAADSPSQERG
jgi:uncharacterized membrane protein YbhN (UPF0104 family)